MMLYPLKGLEGQLSNDVHTSQVKQFSIAPQIVFSRVEKEVYYLKFNNMCHTNQIISNTISVDSDVLKRKLESWIRPEDRKYIKLVSWNTQYSVFAFDADIWLEEALKNSVNVVSYTTFSKSYRLSKQLPYMIRVYGLGMTYEKYIAEAFKRKLRKNTKTREDIFSMITSITNKVLTLDKLNIFEYNYVYSSNSVTVSLKPLFMGSVLAATAQCLKNKDKKKDINFDKTVGLFIKLKQ